MLCSCLYDTIFYQLTQLLFCPSSITCVNSMDASYIPIAEARGFTTHWIKIAARAIHSARSITFKPDSYSHTQYLFPDSPDFRGMPTLQHHLPAEQHRKAASEASGIFSFSDPYPCSKPYRGPQYLFCPS